MQRQVLYGFPEETKRSSQKILREMIEEQQKEDQNLFSEP